MSNENETDGQGFATIEHVNQLWELYRALNATNRWLVERVKAIELSSNGVVVSAQRFTHSTNIRITLLPGGSPDDDATWEKVTLRRGGNGEDITVPYTKDGLAALIAVRDGLAPKRKVGAA